MVKEGLITESDAVMRVEAGQLDQLLHPRLDPDAARNVLSRGLPASPGAASGKIVLSSDLAEDMAQRGEESFLSALKRARKTFTACMPPRGY